MRLLDSFMPCTGTAQSVVTYASSIGHTGDHRDAEQLTGHVKVQAMLVHIGHASLGQIGTAAVPDCECECNHSNNAIQLGRTPQ